MTLLQVRQSAISLSGTIVVENAASLDGFVALYIPPLHFFENRDEILSHSSRGRSEAHSIERRQRCARWKKRDHWKPLRLQALREEAFYGGGLDETAGEEERRVRVYNGQGRARLDLNIRTAPDPGSCNSSRFGEQA